MCRQSGHWLGGDKDWPQYEGGAIHLRNSDWLLNPVGHS